MIKRYITIDEYNSLNSEMKTFYHVQFQEYISHQPDSQSWVDISETKAAYTNNIVQKVYKAKGV